MKRRQFLYSSSIMTGASLLGCQIQNKIDRPNDIISFDLHTHPGSFILKGTDRYPGDEAFLNRVKEMKAKGLRAAFFCVVADIPLLTITNRGVVPKGSFNGDEGWPVFVKQVQVLKELISKSEAKIALKPEELTQKDQLSAYLACEGGDFLGGKVERIDEAYELGLRSIQLVHYAPNELGDLQTYEAQHNGLSSLGKAAVKKMNELGMVIDVAHASHKTVQDVVAISTAPVILSHSILKDDTDSPVAVRAISIEHAKLIADNGGLIGLWPSGYSASLDDFVDHTLRMIDVIGINHVGIGTDMDANFKPVIKNYTEFFDWKNALLKKGLSKKEVAKLLGGNAQRILKKVLK